MEKQEILKAIKELKEKTPKRNFSQTFDLNVVIQNLDLRKEESKIDIFLTLPNSKGKKPKICALVGQELEAQAKKFFDLAINKDDFIKYEKDKKLAKRLANHYDFFIAQANIMQLIAKGFGKVFGPRGKMPNPKAGCVVPPIADLSDLSKKLTSTVRLAIKGKETAIKTSVGNDTMNEDDVAENILAIYETLKRILPLGKDNIKKVLLKFTMGPAYEIGRGFKDVKA